MAVYSGIHDMHYTRYREIIELLIVKQVVHIVTSLT
jgi:hypothetical protein